MPQTDFTAVRSQFPGAVRSQFPGAAHAPYLDVAARGPRYAGARAVCERTQCRPRVDHPGPRA